MSGVLRTAVGVALIVVLVGAPVAAAICAEWCAPSEHAAHLQGHHTAPPHAHEAASAAMTQECHGKAAGGGPALTAEVTPECVDYAMSWREAGPTAPRLHLAPVVSSIPIASALHSPLRVHAEDLARRHAHASPPRPAASGSVLRI